MTSTRSPTCAEVDLAAGGGDVIAMTAANRRFHFAIFDAAGMPRLSRLLRQLWEATDAYRALYFQSRRNRDRVAREHAAMVQALRDRDAEALVALHDRHRDNSVDAVRAILEAPRYLDWIQSGRIGSNHRMTRSSSTDAPTDPPEDP